jgi:hypothetical protein
LGDFTQKSEYKLAKLIRTVTAAAVAAVPTALEVAGGEDHSAALSVIVSSFGELAFELRNVDRLKRI